MVRRPSRSSPLYSSAASDVYKRQEEECPHEWGRPRGHPAWKATLRCCDEGMDSSTIEHFLVVMSAKRQRIVLALHELRGERDEAHTRLQLDHRVARPRDLERSQEARQAAHRRQVLERAEFQVRRPGLPQTPTRDLFEDVAVQRGVVL